MTSNEIRYTRSAYKSAVINSAACYSMALCLLALSLNMIATGHFVGIIAWTFVVLTYSFGSLAIFCHNAAVKYRKKLA